MKLYHELAPYYFSIENNHRDINDDISFIRSLLHGKKDPTLLDLGCGTGEHLNLLSKYGIKCTGIDSSIDMLNIAKKRFPNKIKFIHSNMTEFDYYNEFDIILCLFGSFNYLLTDSDVEKVLWNTWRALKPKGIGLFEIWNTSPIIKIHEKPVTLISTTKVNSITINRERGFNLINYPDKTVVEVNYNYKIDKSNELQTIQDKHIMRTFTKNEIDSFLKNNGLSMKQIFSNFVKEQYHDYSNKMIIHFEKKFMLSKVEE